MWLCGLPISKVARTDRLALSQVLSPMLFIQLARLLSLLTQLVGEPEVFTPRLSTNRPGFIIKAMECYWTLRTRILHLFWCAAKSESKDAWITFANGHKVRSIIWKLKNVQMSDCTRSTPGWFISKFSLWSSRSDLSRFFKCVSSLRLLLFSAQLLFITDIQLES